MYYIMHYSKQYTMNSDSDESNVDQSQHQFEIKMNKKEIENKIKDYLKKKNAMIYHRYK